MAPRKTGTWNTVLTHGTPAARVSPDSSHLRAGFRKPGHPKVCSPSPSSSLLSASVDFACICSQVVFAFGIMGMPSLEWSCSWYTVPKCHQSSGHSRFWVAAAQGSGPQQLAEKILYHSEGFVECFPAFLVSSHQIPEASPSPDDQKCVQHCQMSPGSTILPFP